MTDEVKQHMRTYMNGLAWLFINLPDSEIDETKGKFEKVEQRVAEEEAWLKDHGITQDQIKDIIDRAQKFVETPITEMTRDQQLMICKLIFGSKTEWSNEPERPRKSQD